MELSDRLFTIWRATMKPHDRLSRIEWKGSVNRRSVHEGDHLDTVWPAGSASTSGGCKACSRKQPGARQNRRDSRHRQRLHYPEVSVSDVAAKEIAVVTGGRISVWVWQAEKADY